MLGVWLGKRNLFSSKGLGAGIGSAKENACWGRAGVLCSKRLVGRVGVEPTVNFRWQIMRLLPATNTASGPAQAFSQESGGGRS